VTLWFWVIFGVLLVIASIVVIRFFPTRQKDAQHLYIDALEQLIRGKRESAFIKLRELIKTNTDHVNAYIYLGNILREMAKPEKAVTIHQSLTARSKLISEQKLDIFTSLAKDYFALKQYQRAEENAGRVLHIDKKNQWAVQFLVKIAEKTKRWTKASDQLKRLEKLTGNMEPIRHSNYIIMEGWENEKGGKNQEAINFYLKAIKIAPDFPDAYLYLANLYEREGKLDKAVENWMKYAERTKVTDSQVFTKLEKTLFELGRFGEIEDFYSQLIKMKEDNVDAISGYVNVLLAKGEINRARNLINEALTKNNQSVKAYLTRLKLSLREIKQDQLSKEVDKILTLIREDKKYRIPSRLKVDV